MADRKDKGKMYPEDEDTGQKSSSTQFTTNYNPHDLRDSTRGSDMNKGGQHNSIGKLDLDAAKEDPPQHIINLSGRKRTKKEIVASVQAWQNVPAAVGEDRAKEEGYSSHQVNATPLAAQETSAPSDNDYEAMDPMPVGELIFELQTSVPNRLVIPYEPASRHFPEPVPGTWEILHLTDHNELHWFMDLNYDGESHSYIITQGFSLYIEHYKLNPPDLILIYVPIKGQKLHVNHFNIKHKKLLGRSLSVVENTKKLTVAPFKIKGRKHIRIRVPLKGDNDQEITPHIQDLEPSKKAKTKTEPGVPYVPVQPSRYDLKSYPMYFAGNYMWQHKRPCVLLGGQKSYNSLKAVAAMNEWSKDNETYTRNWIQPRLWVELCSSGHRQYGRVGSTCCRGASDNTWIVDFLGEKREIEIKFLRSHIPPVGHGVLVLRGEYQNLTAMVTKKIDIQQIAFIKIVADNTEIYNNRELSIGYGYICATRD